MSSIPAPVHHGHQPGSARAALAYPDFRRMWVASFSSNIGTWMQNVVLPAYVYSRTGKASVVGILVFAQLCLLYTSDAADERSSVDLGGRRIIKKKNRAVQDAGRIAHTM